MSKFTPTPIKRIGRVVTGKTPSTAIADNFDGEFMFVTPTELHTDFIITRSEKTLTRRGLDSIRTNSIKGLSIAVGCIGWGMGNVALINEECATNQQINSITDINADKYNPYYLYYWLLTKKAYLFQISTVTRTPILNKTTFENILVPLPTKSIQDRVASVLLPISRKIALNNAIKVELEKTAKLIYDYWFTQFDFPDENGKPYRSSGGAMEYNSQLKREIPKGWKVKTLRQCVTSINTGLNPRQNFKLGMGNNRYITIKNIINGRLDFSKCDFIDDDALRKIHERSDVSAGDILFTSIDPVGRLYWVRENPENWDINESVFSIRPNNTVVSTDYLYAVMDSETFRAKLISLRTGSVQKGIRIGSIEAVHIVIPSDSVMDSFSARVHPFYEKMSTLEKQTNYLTALRDFLLPMLMNGQVTVATAESVVEQLAVATAE